MFSSRLKMFLIMSSALHIGVLGFAAFTQPGQVDTLPQAIKVGVISKYRDPGAGSSAESLRKEEPKTEKTASKPERKVVKTVERKKPKEKAPEKKETVSVVDKTPVEQETAQVDENAEGVETSSAAPPATTDSDVAEEGIGDDSAGTGQGAEIAFPDYRINPKPSYPMIARRNGYEGMVLLRVLVTENGKVGRIELERSSGYGLLDESAVKAVKDWVFIPGKRGGESVSSWVTVPIRFQLSSGQ